VGLLPGAGGQRLPRMIGILAAMPFLMEGKQLQAVKAREAGLVDEVAPELLGAAKAWPDPRCSPGMKGFRIPGGGPLDARVAPAFVVGNTLLQAKTFHNMPAPLCIQSCIYEGCQLPIDKGLRIESKYMATLSRSPVARGMIRTLFVNKTKAEKGMHRPAGFEPFQCRKLGLMAQA
jgi:3-hydroxyacyl-CoA dehydrogenase/enoyl-CoA hydratase/3-hydroxybutyryl-CoA epimerase